MDNSCSRASGSSRRKLSAVGEDTDCSIRASSSRSKSSSESDTCRPFGRGREGVVASADDRVNFERGGVLEPLWRLGVVEPSFDDKNRSSSSSPPPKESKKDSSSSSASASGIKKLASFSVPSSQPGSSGSVSVSRDVDSGSPLLPSTAVNGKGSGSDSIGDDDISEYGSSGGPVAARKSGIGGIKGGDAELEAENRDKSEELQYSQSLQRLSQHTAVLTHCAGVDWEIEPNGGVDGCELVSGFVAWLGL